jgi:signal recognition particle receptor subunit beta
MRDAIALLEAGLREGHGGRRRMLEWLVEWIKDWWLGSKKVVVLGPRAAGKSTLVRFLLEGELPVEYLVTAKPERFEGRKVSMGDIDLQVAPITDVPGDEQSHAEWERQFQEADVAAYLIDARKVWSGDSTYIKTIDGEMRHIGEWLEKRIDKPPRFLLIATHCDLIAEYATLASGDKSAFTDAFWKNPVLRRLVHHGRGTKHVDCIAGSLSERTASEQLVGEIFRRAAA